MKFSKLKSNLLFILFLFTLLFSNVQYLKQEVFSSDIKIKLNSITTETKLELIWEQIYEGPFVEEGKSIIKCPGNGYVISGWTNSSGVGDLDVLVMRIADDGTHQWNVTIGDVEEDKGFQVISLQSGGYAVISTYMNTSAVHTNSDIMLTRIAEDGTIQWNKYYSGPEQDDVTSWVGDLGRSIVECSNGDIALAGVTVTDEGNCDVYLFRVAPNGILLWNRTFHNWDIDRCYTPHSLVLCDDGGFALACYTYNETQSNDVWIIRTNQFGVHLWNKTYGDSGGYQRPEGLVQCSDGGFAIIANTHTFCLGYSDAWVIRTDSFGNQLWNQTYGGEESDGGGFIAELPNEDLVFSGTTHSFDVGNGDAWLVRIAMNGSLIWNHTLGNEYGNSGGPFVNEGNDTYTVLGGTMRVGESFGDIWIFKTQIVTYYINESTPTLTPSTTTETESGSISMFILINEFLITAFFIIKVKKKKKANLT